MKRSAITPEGAVKKAVMDLLAAYKIPAFRMNAGDRFGAYKGKKWRIAGHAPGTADILALPRLTLCGLSLSWGCKQSEHEDYHFDAPYPVWIEVKAPGKKQTEAQQQFQGYAETNFHVYLLIDNPDKLKHWLETHEAHS